MAGLVILALPLAAALSVDSYELRRNQAYKRTDDHSPGAGEALLALLKERPNDGSVLFALGRVAWHKATLLETGSRRKQLNIKVLDHFARARAAGFADPMIDSAFREINADGSENKVTLSNRATVDRLLQEGGKYFGQRQFPKAIEKYSKAFSEEPTNYPAALYTGDAYFASGKNQEALEWFDKARALNPDRETAHRYAGDALMKLGRQSEALSRFLEGCRRRTLQWLSLAGLERLLPGGPDQTMDCATKRAGGWDWRNRWQDWNRVVGRFHSPRPGVWDGPPVLAE